MLRLYMPILLLQVFCVYHAYRNNAEQKWYWMILFLPLIGCLIYLYELFYGQAVAGGAKNAAPSARVATSPRIERLEKAYHFSDNVASKTSLADAYSDIGRYKEAIELYKSCLDGIMADDISLRLKLLNAYFQDEDYESAIGLGKELETESAFKTSPGRIAYAWSLHYQGKTELAEQIFQDMDKKFTNYEHRWEYCKLLSETKRADDLKGKLADLMEEFEHMGSTELRLNKAVIAEIKNLSNSISRNETASG